MTKVQLSPQYEKDYKELKVFLKAFYKAVKDQTNRYQFEKQLQKSMEEIHEYYTFGDSFRTEKEVAAEYSGLFTLSWLQRSRQEGKGPMYHKIGGKIYYGEKELMRYIRSQRITTTN